MKLFLRAKHWQLFLVTYGLPILIQILGVVGLLSVASQLESGGVEPNPFAMVPFFLVILLAMGGIMGWMWSVGVGLQDKLPQGMEMKTGRFKAFMIYPFVYIAFFACMWLFLFTSMTSGVEPNFNPLWMLAIFPMHLFAMFCMFHNMWFTAKTLKSVELQREAKFADFAGEFFLIWFWVVGVWIIQPKVNLLSEGITEES